MKKIVSIGAGNVATHLLPHLKRNGYEITQIYSRNLSNAQKLAKKVKGTPVDKLDQLYTKADFYMFLVPDDTIVNISKRLPFKPTDKQIICHSSGSVSSKVLDRFKSYGVFYPLQSFSKAVRLNLSEIPFCITANHLKTERQLVKMARIFSKEVHIISNAQRKSIHLSAVIANNFVNHLLLESAQILDNQSLDFDLLKPLIKETIKKAFSNHPKEVQTGPAKRNDKIIISEHIGMLENNKQLQKIYKLLSHAIKLQHK